jgi:DNA transposition AAA+ family ATPase
MEDSMAATIRLRTSQFEKFCKIKGWKTQADKARGLKVTEPTVGRIVNGDRKPGEQFIAAVLSAFPELDFGDLFEVIDDEPASVPA